MPHAIHITTLKRMLQSPEPVDLKLWTRSGESAIAQPSVAQLSQEFNVDVQPITQPSVAQLTNSNFSLPITHVHGLRCLCEISILRFVLFKNTSYFCSNILTPLPVRTARSGWVIFVYIRLCPGFHTPKPSKLLMNKLKYWKVVACNSMMKCEQNNCFKT